MKNTTKDQFEQKPPTIEQAIRHHLRISLAKDISDVNREDLFHALSLAVKDRAVEQLLKTEHTYRTKDVKRIYYLSMEFLVGRTLSNNILNLGLFDECHSAVAKFGSDLEDVLEAEKDPALGNGGLGRLAACFLDSLATLNMPGFGYGINYQFGLFKQAIENGYQREKPDRWLADSAYWQITRTDKSHAIPLYGHVETSTDCLGNIVPKWVGTRTIMGVPHDMPIIGYGGKTVNFLRLYSAQTSDDFDVSIFNQGDYLKAVEDKIASEKISKVLYPSDSEQSGKELRFVQEYFFVTCALRDILRRYLRHHSNFDQLSDKIAIQLNDTHPAIAVADLMHLLVDEHSLSWDVAWDHTKRIMGYTNHTLLSEALEKWSVALFERVLPRHLQIIYEINSRMLDEVSKHFPNDSDRLRRMSIIEEGSTRFVRMAHLAITGSHSVNGVAAVHSELVKRALVPDFYQLWPEKFNNKTNGVTPRRWLLKANSELAIEISKLIGDDWICDLSRLKELEDHAEDKNVQKLFKDVKNKNKNRLSKLVRDTTGIHLNPSSLIDSQSKRIHLYKRQLLNILRVIDDYLQLVEDRNSIGVPQTYVFSGKAAPGYWAAKQSIKLINNVAQTVNQDPRSRDQLTVVFIPDYRVSVAEVLIPATDISEQISTAGMEASGTGNMKFALNGALTIGTRDGATIEMAEHIGEENMYLFGLSVQEAQKMKEEQSYNPYQLVSENQRLQRVIDAIRSNRFSISEPGIFNGLIDILMDHNDPFLHLADFATYAAKHRQAVDDYAGTEWVKRSILNIARMGYFSSDRTISEYAQSIWNVKSTA